MRKIYKFNQEKLYYEEISKYKISSLFAFCFISMFLVLGSFVIPKGEIKEKQLTEYEKITIISEMNKFSEDKLVDKLKELHFKFPYIVLAQSMIETGGFTSHIFKDNHNLFGMKEAKVRLNLAKGTQFNHAYYDNWEQSVIDYALYASSYLKEINSESEYFIYLGQHYAEDPNYVSKLKKLIDNLQLKTKF